MGSIAKESKGGNSGTSTGSKISVSKFLSIAVALAEVSGSII